LFDLAEVNSDKSVADACESLLLVVHEIIFGKVNSANIVA